MTRRGAGKVLAVAVAAVVTGCGGPAEEDPAGAETVEVSRLEAVLADGRDRITARADSMDEALRPLPLLTSRQEAALRSRPNAEHLRHARSLGISPPGSEAGLDSLREAGRLVRLSDSTAHWIVRELEHSRPLVTPDVPVLLEEIGRRFHARLDSLGVPPVRLEVSSVLRTTEQQADLRTTNPNATRGTSAHEFGTTVDVAYSGYRAPDRAGSPAPPTGSAASRDALPALARTLHELEILAVERVAARRSRELKAILGHVLREMQDEGKVLVTLERRQPVYHMTVGRRLAESPE